MYNDDYTPEIASFQSSEIELTLPGSGVPSRQGRIGIILPLSTPSHLRMGMSGLGLIFAIAPVGVGGVAGLRIGKTPARTATSSPLKRMKMARTTRIVQ
jgi:hypothetical protein